MNAPASLHPTDQTLSDYGLGKLDEASARSVDGHLESCAECRRRVGEVPGDSFLGKLRAAQGSNGGDDPSRAGDAAPGRGSPVPPVDSLPPELAAHPDYEIVRELGRGGMGVVYLARNRLMGRMEVLKVVGRHLVERPGVLDRFLREIRSAAKLQHQNIVTAYAATRAGEGVVLAMEYVEGDDLAALVKRGGPLPVANACYFVYQAALGLQHAHTRGMVHRDIKPANLILAREGKRAVVKVLDFGLAKVTSEGPVDGGLTHEGQMLGTPDYISPEQTLDAQKADIRADIYSLGCTFYFLLTGAPPFRGASLYDLLQAHQSMNARPLNLVRPEVPVELAALVAKMMAKEPARRFQTPGEVAQALTRFFKPGANPGSSAVADPPRVAPAPSMPKTDGAVRIPPPAKAAPEGVAWGSLIEFKETERSAVGPMPGRAKTKSLPDASTPRRRLPWFPVSVAVGALLFGLLVAWGAGFLRVKTAEGTVVLVSLPEGADVFVDGEKIKVRLLSGGEAEVTAPPGRHGVEVKMKGLRTFGREVTVEAGGTQRLTVRLDGIPDEKAKPTPDVRTAVAELPSGSVDLLSLLDPARHTVSGRWRREGSALVSVADAYDVIKIPYQPPEDYSIEVKAERISGKNDLQIGFTCGRARVVAVIDGWGGRFSGLSSIDGTTAHRNETAHPGQVFPDRGPVHLVLTVRKGRVLAKADGRTIVDWKGDANRLSSDQRFDADPGPLFLGVQVGGSYRIDAMTLTPLSGNPEAPAVTPPLTTTPGFVSLFNGKDLTGWKTHPVEPGRWRVENGILSDPGNLSHLYSERGDYRDFHLRVEARIGKNGNSGVYFRAPFGPFNPKNNWNWPNGYEASIFTYETPRTYTGSLYDAVLTTLVVFLGRESPVDRWFVLEVIAEGNRIRIKVDGETTADYTDPKRLHASGHLALESRDDSAVVEFRRVEIKELSPADGTSAASESRKPEFVPLFNGKDMTGWKTHPVQPGHWRVENGAITDPGGTSHLYSERGDYKDFHLRVEARIGKNGNSGVYFRAPFGPYNAAKNQNWPDGYEAAVNTYKTFRGGTGSLVEADQSNLILTEGHESPVDRWFVLEVIAEGNRLRVKVDGETTADYTDPKRLHASGHLALQSDARGGNVEFRKVEIKELSPPDGNPTATESAKQEFVPLFNGRDLTGWDVMRTGGPGDEVQEPGEGGWSVSDGKIWCMTKESGWLKSNRVYANFVLQLEFIPSKGCNGGIYVRCPDQGRLSVSGTEIQIIDDVNNLELKKYPEAAARSRRTGAIHGVVGPSRRALRVGAQWNSLEIVCENGRIAVKLNGFSVVDADEAQFPALKGRLRQGYVGLSNWHGQAKGMGFRNIRIKELK